MRKFDYTFLKNISIDSQIMMSASYIEAMKTDVLNKKLRHSNLFECLVSIAKIRSVKSSNEIEGIVSTDKRITAIVNGMGEPISHDEQEIAGYRDALKIIHENYDQISFSERDILSLHSVLLSYAKSPHRGQYKQNDNLIVAVSNDGVRSVRFRPLSAFETEEGMEQLVLAYLDARDNASINPLLLIPCVILDFLCIHPFMDGNGRISRLLSLLLLYQGGYDVGKYVSFEGMINDHKDEYYEALQKSSLDWEDNQNNYVPFIRNFLRTLELCYQDLEKRFIGINKGIMSKEKRIIDIVLNSLLPLSKKDIHDLLPDISVSTIERVLAVLLKQNKIIKRGTFKDARYQRK
ncbi:MAG: Fic family protein [Bacilli bacterium]|jgi:Fic family protein